MLLVSDRDTEGKYKGKTAPVTTTAAQERWSSAYLDPVSLGMTILDKEMLTSMELAGRVCQSILRENHQSLRVSPDIGRLEHYIQLAGGSAGGIVTLASCATALGIRLNQTVTASFQIQETQESKKQPEKELTIDDLTFAPVRKESIAAKLHREVLGSALTGTGEQLNTVYLHHNQKCCLNGQAPLEWNDWTKIVSNQQKVAIKPVKEQTSLRTLIHQMSGDERIEHVLSEYAESVRDEWQRMTQGEVPDRGDDHKLDIYIEPRLSVQLTPEEQYKLRSKHEDVDFEKNTTSGSNEFHELERGIDELVEKYVIDERNWLLITEIAGGGKTVLSWRLLNELSSLTEPFLVVRYEDEWPKDLRGALEKAVSRYCSDYVSPSPGEVIDYLLAKRRVVVILDALDQVDHEVSKTLTRLHQAGNQYSDLSHENIQMIVTSRPHAVNQWPDRFNKEIWRHFHLELFDSEQIENYKKQLRQLREVKNPGEGKLVDEYWGTITEQQENDELLQLPNNLKLVRAIIEDALYGETKVRPFKTAGDLHWETAYRGFHRDSYKGDVAEFRQPGDVEELIHAAACLGFEILHQATQENSAEEQDPHSLYHVPEIRISKIKKKAGNRYGSSEESWKKYDAMLRKTILTGSTTLKKNDEEELSFPSLKTMEFFVGLYLSRYASKTDIDDIKIHIGDNRWNNAWKFAIEMLETTDSSGNALCNFDSYSCMMKQLFIPPLGQYLRPTELMFRVWQILKRNEDSSSEIKSCLDKLLDFYRSSFRQILIERDEQGEPTERAFRAAELVHEEDLPDLVTKAIKEREENLVVQLDQLAGKTRAERQTQKTIKAELSWLEDFDEEPVINAWVKMITPHHQSYSRCADSIHDRQTGSDDYLSFMLGASPEDDEARDDEKPWQMVRVKAFDMAACCVTKAQYHLFDPQLEQQYESDFSQISPEPDCPVIHTNWFDGVMLSLWLGDQYRLPSEFEWEGAAWGGVDRWITEKRKLKYSVPYKDSITINEANFLSKLGRTLPVRWDQERYQTSQDTELKEIVGNHYSANGFGLYHVNGNVWEWSSTVWNGDLLKERLLEIFCHKQNRAHAETSIEETMQWFEQESGLETKQAWLQLWEEMEPLEAPIAWRDHVNSDRSLRGGSWGDTSSSARSSHRFYNWVDPDFRIDIFGLRLLRTK